MLTPEQAEGCLMAIMPQVVFRVARIIKRVSPETIARWKAEGAPGVGEK